MSIIINRVYTKTGDRGTTHLVGGQSVAKTDIRIEAYGTVDELNAAMGLFVEALDPQATEAALRTLRGRACRIQNELFDLGGELATLASDRHEKQILISKDDVLRLETEMDAVNEHLPTLRSFVLPGGGQASAFAHLARTVARRAERCIVRLHQESAQRDEVLQYVNRLSDWLFVMGRQAAVCAGAGEVLWRPGDRGE